MRERENYYLEYQTAPISPTEKIVIYHTECGHFFVAIHTYTPIKKYFIRSTEYIRIRKRDMTKLVIELQNTTPDYYNTVLRKYEKRRKNNCNL